MLKEWTGVSIDSSTVSEKLNHNHKNILSWMQVFAPTQRVSRRDRYACQRAFWTRSAHLPQFPPTHTCMWAHAQVRTSARWRDGPRNKKNAPSNIQAPSPHRFDRRWLVNITSFRGGGDHRAHKNSYLNRNHNGTTRFCYNSIKLFQHYATSYYTAVGTLHVLLCWKRKLWEAQRASFVSITGQCSRWPLQGHFYRTSKKLSL